MNKIQFSKGTDPGATEVLSPLSGHLPRVHRHFVAGSPKPIALFPGSGAQLMRVPQFGYSLETLAFGICGAASLALLLITVLRVN
jgi:hypothetical protein